MEYLSDQFRRFFKNLNVGVGVEQTASREYAAVKEALEDRRGPAAQLAIRCFLQGSYRQETAIHDLNDVDVVALCELWQPGSGGPGTATWDRDAIFGTVAAALNAKPAFRGRVRYGPQSMCVKVDLDIKVEVLPVVYAADNHDASKEPFRLFRPRTGSWEDGFARYHQSWLSYKNRDETTSGNFIPAIKVLKHIRTMFGLKSVSFHIETLLFRIPDGIFGGAPVDYITAVLSYIAATSASDWYRKRIETPCGDRDIFTATEWIDSDWNAFHEMIVTLAGVARSARSAPNATEATRLWRVVLRDYFPNT